MTTMQLLALDLGTSCGWCLTNGSLFSSGVWRLAAGRFEGGGMRYLRFRNLLKEMFDLGKVDRVAYEEVRMHLGTDAAHLYGGFQAVLTEECELRGIPYQGIPVGTIKKHATGKGNAKKDAMIEAAHQKWPAANISDDNEADARHLADFIITSNHNGKPT
jgi:Holliday junction resolvasome RuvABC endonuclease subunit